MTALDSSIALAALPLFVAGMWAACCAVVLAYMVLRRDK